MTYLFLALIVLAAVLLGFVVLIQNPKGGGLAGNVGGIGNQLMGVKQTTDVLEKGTWIFAALIAILSIVSIAFISKTNTGGLNKKQEELMKKVGTSGTSSTPSNTTTIDTTKK
jgi:preprotein translocase subunit SecG